MRKTKPMNGGGIADLPLMRTAKRRENQVSRELTDSLVKDTCNLFEEVQIKAFS